MNGPAPIIWNIDVEKAIANSYRDFHVKGFDYICLDRKPERTKKLYFFDGDVSKIPEIVNPHDHRYNFDTRVLAGASENIWFDRDPAGELFTRFDYMTPLNGGAGFTYAGDDQLLEVARIPYRAKTRGDFYRMAANEFHTIRMLENETVLLLTQYDDVVPIDKPTSTFTRGTEPPSLTGLYNRFTKDGLIARLKNFGDRTGVTVRFT